MSIDIQAIKRKIIPGKYFWDPMSPTMVMSEETGGPIVDAYDSSRFPCLDDESDEAIRCDNDAAGLAQTIALIPDLLEELERWKKGFAQIREIASSNSLYLGICADPVTAVFTRGHDAFKITGSHLAPELAECLREHDMALFEANRQKDNHNDRTGNSTGSTDDA